MAILPGEHSSPTSTMTMSKKPFLRSKSLPMMELHLTSKHADDKRRNGCPNVHEALGRNDVLRLRKLNKTSAYLQRCMSFQQPENILKSKQDVGASPSDNHTYKTNDIGERHNVKRRVGLADIFNGVKCEDIAALLAEYSSVGDSEVTNDRNTVKRCNRHESRDQTVSIPNPQEGTDSNMVESNRGSETQIDNSKRSKRASRRRMVGMMRSVSFDQVLRPCGYRRRNGLGNVLEDISENDYKRLLYHRYAGIAV